MNKRLLIISNYILVLFFLNIERTKVQNQHIELFQLSDVEISNSPFHDAIYASGGVHVTSSVRQSVDGDLVFNSDFMIYLSVSACGCHDNRMW
mgnify:CR=1 FL=1|tara:strand:- start:1116 stop:1394 length:279 start_codon:yes stop_codon:yes gene_type:complete